MIITSVAAFIIGFLFGMAVLLAFLNYGVKHWL
jgi:hypothetical protein